MKRHITFTLDNASQLTMETLRDMIRQAVAADARFKDETGETHVWVVDLVAPTVLGESWQAILELNGKYVSVPFTVENEIAKLGDKIVEGVFRRSYYVAIGNDGGFTMALGNSMGIDDDGWALIAPFGEHPKTRVVKTQDGYVTQHFVQVLDNAAAEQLVKGENSLFRRIKRAIVGIPVFADETGADPHPDLRVLAPETVTTGNARPVPVGVVDSIRLGKDGIEAHFTLTPDGAQAVENGAKFPSALWKTKLVETLSNGVHRVVPFQLLSVGLTPFPNIDGVDSLANARPGTPAAKTTTEQKNENVMKNIIIGWLAANGTVLANDASEQVVLKAVQDAFERRGSDLATLGNAKAAAETKLQEAETALGNANNRIAALERDRKLLIGTAVDLAIHKGQIEVSKRDEQIEALSNSKDLEADLKRFSELPVVVQLGNSKTADRDKAGAAVTRSAREQIFHLANTDERYKGLAWDQAYELILKDHPTLREQLKQAPAVK